MIVPKSDAAPSDLLDRLIGAMPDFSPEVRKAAAHVLENPNDIGVSSIREIAAAAHVKPNTLVRMAQTVGCEGYEDFREPFREDIRRGQRSFPDRARWLQSLATGDSHHELMAAMASASIENIEKLFSETGTDALRAAAEEIVNARATYVLGVGIANPIARNFAYLAGMAVDTVFSVPRDGSLPIDGLARAETGDVLLAMTFRPYRREVLDAVEAANDQGMRLISISDSLASPIMAHAAHRFLVPMDTPQFFTSGVALSALLETLMAFVIAEADPTVIANIEKFHQRRHDLGVYVSAEGSRR